MDKKENIKDTEWSSQYLFDIPLIDEQHAGFFSRVNEIVSLYKEKSDFPEENIKGVLNDLENYMLLHFEYEEELMKEAGYGNIDQHITEHRYFISKINEYILEQDFSSVYLFDKMTWFMKKWFLNHIIRTDFLYAPEVKKIFRPKH